MRVADVARCAAYGASPGFPCLAPDDGTANGAAPNAFKPNINLVVIDFLVRHGHIPPESPGYLRLVSGLRQGDCK